MKAIIPVAGAGTRLRPHTYTQPKPLIPVAGKTIISFIIDSLVEVGVDEFVFIIGYMGEKIKNFVEENYPNLKTEFVTQNARLGSAHAIWTAREVIKDAEEIFIMFGDTIVDVDLKKILDDPHSCLGIKKVNDPREFGVVELDSDHFVKRVVEKPNIPKSNLAMVGLYKIKEVKLLLEVIHSNIEKELLTHGEHQLTDAIMRMIDAGTKFSTVGVDNWFDCGKKEVLLETNEVLLDREGYASDDLPPFDKSIIIHPVSIGKNCNIQNSIVGPYVTIGNNTSINNAIISSSIIGSYASIQEVVLRNSLVGSDASIKGINQSLNIGDNTEIDFS